jgi:hypothetical protein
MTTKNTDKLRQEVAKHVAADSVVQGIYWNRESNRGCFIGCLAQSDDPRVNETTYGLPIMVQRIAESIFESLPANEAKSFFAALPGAVSCDGKDLSNVGWQFLAAELRALPKQSDNIQAVIDPVIEGMDLLVIGQEWPADAAASAAYAARAAAAADAANAANAARAAAWAAADAAWAAADAAHAAADAAWAAADAAHAADWIASATADAARLRQRDLLLQLISEAPVVEVSRG